MKKKYYKIFKINRGIIIIANSLINRMRLIKNKVNINKGFKINGQIYIRNTGSLYIGKNFSANSGKMANPIGGDTILRLIVREKASLYIGDGVGISNSTIVCQDKITIGDRVLIGGGCKIWDTDFHSLDYINRGTQRDAVHKKTAEITIGDSAFIGGGAIILKGVNIGVNTIIAAGSVVTKSVPDNEIWGGNPAKKIRSINF